MATSRTWFDDYKDQKNEYISVQGRDYYFDVLPQAAMLYAPVFARFGKLLDQVDSSESLLRLIMDSPSSIRTQLLRIFRRVISPDTPVEMLKIKRRTPEIIINYGDRFADIEKVRELWRKRAQPDEAMAMILWEHHDRGGRGYELTEQFFDWFELAFEGRYMLEGPRRAGIDVQLQQKLPNFVGEVPADFIIARESDRVPLVIGFAHYDSDRGGSQEDDRTSGNADKVNKVMEYASRYRIPLKVLFLNDGPGLELGGMWSAYSKLERDNEVGSEQRVMVLTFKMLEERLTPDWIEAGVAPPSI